MVQAKTLEKFISQSPEIAQAAGTDPATARRIMEAIEERIKSNRRHPAPQPPVGGISIRAASRKYGMRHTTIVRWVKEGFIPVILETKNEKFINEKITIAIIHKFKSFTGEGRKTIRKVLSGGSPCSEK